MSIKLGLFTIIFNFLIISGFSQKAKAAVAADCAALCKGVSNSNCGLPVTPRQLCENTCQMVRDNSKDKACRVLSDRIVETRKQIGRGGLRAVKLKQALEAQLIVHNAMCSGRF